MAGLIHVFLAAGILALGCMMECEYPFWPTLWLAEQAKIPDGRRVTDLIRLRSGGSYVEQHWHHCAWCDDMYPHVPHLAVRVTVNSNLDDFYLFDWDARHRRLLPMTVRTAKLFPELIPSGYVIKPQGLGPNPQLYYHDEPCLIVAH